MPAGSEAGTGAAAVDNGGQLLPPGRPALDEGGKTTNAPASEGNTREKPNSGRAEAAAFDETGVDLLRDDLFF